MRIEKYLIIEKLELTSAGNAPYRLFLRDPQNYQLKSEFTIGREELIEANIEPTDRIIGKRLLVCLKSEKWSQDKSAPEIVTIQDLQKIGSINWSYGSVPPGKRKEEKHTARLHTPVWGGTLTILPCPLYKLELSLTEEEYEKFRKLPKATVFRINLHLERKKFTDIVLTYRSYFNSPRILPEGYLDKSIPLIKSAIDYFKDDIDVISHLSGLEFRIETEEKETRYNPAKWQHDYFLIEPYGRNWKEMYIKNAKKVDGVLKERFKNRLPIQIEGKFYHDVEVISYEGKQPCPVQEITIGLGAGLCFSKGYMLPAVEIETRSIDSNIKACESVCQTLMERAKELFKLKHHSVHLSMERS